MATVKKKSIALLMAVLLTVSMGMTGCGAQKSDYTPVPGLDESQKVTLKIAIPYETNKALNTVSNAFMAKYPNVSVQLQYIEDYDVNAVQLFKDNLLDIILQKDVFFAQETVKDATTGEQKETGRTTDDYFYNFAADEEIDFSETTPDITDNYRHTRTDETGAEISYQYSYPLGGETRGVFVNKSLLDQYGLSVPGNYTELLHCCEVLKQAGLIPIQGGGDTAAFGLALAPAANAIVHDETALEAVRTAKPGVSALFKPTFEKMHVLATERYFDYKAVEESGWYLVTNELGQAESFLGLSTDPATFEVSKPENNIGNVAFMPYLSSTETVIRSLIEEYALDTELVFICSPLNDEGENSPAYITPYYGVCANKNSENLIWAREFVNFLFRAENNTLYAQEASIIPNTADALSYAAAQYDLDIEKDITLCGQIRFSTTYNGYTPIANTAKEVLKCSAQKYMVDLNLDADGNIQYETDETGREFLYMGNGETIVYKEYVGQQDAAKPGFAFCTLEYYLDAMEKSFDSYR